MNTKQHLQRAMTARIITFRPRPLAPIRVEPEDRLPPGPCIIGMVLVSLGLWFIGWIVWGWL